MVAMHRQLAKEHPIHVLLEPHMEGTAFINWGAQEVRHDMNFTLNIYYSKYCGKHLRKALSHKVGG